MRATVVVSERASDMCWKAFQLAVSDWCKVFREGPSLGNYFGPERGYLMEKVFVLEAPQHGGVELGALVHAESLL